MELKLDEQGHAVLSDKGHPIYIHPDGKETPHDAKDLFVKLATANRQAGEVRTELKAAEERLKAFADIEDPDAARKALAFAASLDGKKVMGDEEIEKMFQARLKPVIEENATLKTGIAEKDGHIYKLEVSRQFAASPYLKEKTIFGATPDLAEAYFGPRFKIVDGQRIAYEPDGNPIWSSINAGKYADFDEAVAHMINSHPQKDHMLKAAGGGSGAPPNGGGGGGGGGKTMSRDAFSKLDPQAQSDFSIKGGTLTD